jgi:leucine dehydrogenase
MLKMEHDFYAQMESWNGDRVVIRHDRATGSWIFVALHDITVGPASGGTRMKVYDHPSQGLRDAMRLAEGMTCKWAAIDFEYGGGKAVLAVPHKLQGQERQGLLRRYGRLVESLGGQFRTGVDLGTTPADMAEVARETAHVHGVDHETWETVDAGPFTARGVFAGVLRTVQQLQGGGDVSGSKIHVQGVGSVGGQLAHLLRQAGAELLISDLDHERGKSLADEVEGRFLESDAALSEACDVYAPCAVGATLNSDTIPHLGCRAVAGSANNQLAERQDAQRLVERGILYAPDYIVNAGGAIAFSMIRQGEETSAIEARIDRISETLGEIFEDATERGESPLDAATRRVKRVLEARRGEGA